MSCQFVPSDLAVPVLVVPGELIEWHGMCVPSPSSPCSASAGCARCVNFHVSCAIPTMQCQCQLCQVCRLSCQLCHLPPPCSASVGCVRCVDCHVSCATSLPLCRASAGCAKCVDCHVSCATSLPRAVPVSVVSGVLTVMSDVPPPSPVQCQCRLCQVC